VDKPEVSEVELLRKQLADSQSMIGRQANELGQLRKHVTDMTPKPEPVTPDQVLTDPVGSTKKLVQEELNERRVREQEQQKAIYDQRVATANFLAQQVPDIVDLIPDMAEIARQDGVPEEYIERFKQDILTESPFITIQLAKRAKMLREVNELRNGKKALERKPGELVDKINKAAKTRPAVSGGHGHTNPSGIQGLTREQVAKMSTAELDELLKG
jgi:hypothetical protein